MSDDNRAPDTPQAETGTAPETLPRRDYFILPLLSLLTVFLMFVISEATTRALWYAHEENACVISDDPVDGYRIRPNCTARTKGAESPWVTYRFNECGYRSNTSCGPVPPGTLRIAILGASVSQGLNMPYEDTYFARSAEQLSQLCGRPIDVQNLGKPRASPIYAYRRVQDALTLKPDVVLFLLAPFDLEQQIDPKALAERDDPAHRVVTTDVYEPLSLMRRIQLLITDSRTALVAEHFLLRNRDTYLRLYLHYGDKADFLRQPFTPLWQRRFADMDLIIGGMADKFHTAGVPFIVIPVPSRAEAALLSSPAVPAGVDPFAYGHELEKIADAHGASYVDLMAPFSKIPDANSLFFIVDGHLADLGQKVVATSLTRKLVDGTIPAFAGCANGTARAGH
jgi:hypothetical protein